MDEHDPWAILSEQGISIRPFAADRTSWQYGFPILEATWYGPYETQSDALRAALRHLFLLAQRGSSVISNIPTTLPSAGSSSSDLATQLKALKTLLRELQIARAKLESKDAVDLEVRLKQVREQIALLNQQATPSDNG
jgi:hypothetical protein